MRAGVDRLFAGMLALVQRRRSMPTALPSRTSADIPGASSAQCAPPREDVSMNRNVSMLALAAASALFAAPAFADTSDKKIAFSNNYAGNSWRQAMLKSYDLVTKKAVADKVVGAADVFTTADKEVPTQAAQIQNLILQGYNAIVINAASPDALNGAIKQAIDAGIVVVSFDGIVTEPGAWRVVIDFKDYGSQEVEH